MDARASRPRSYRVFLVLVLGVLAAGFAIGVYWCVDQSGLWALLVRTQVDWFGSYRPLRTAVLTVVLAVGMTLPVVFLLVLISRALGRPRRTR